jgi:sugar O-acyltransferase (sialic acid O-acetyltransferase NeuD family)
MRKYAIYGAGAFGQELFLTIKDMSLNGDGHQFVGFIDDFKAIGTQVKYGTVIGGIDFINNVDYELDIAIAINSSKVISETYEKIINPKVRFPNFIHPSVAYLDKDSVTIGKGNIIARDGIVSFDVKLGDFNCFNTRVSIGHHVEMGSFNIFNPNVQLSGSVKIGDANMFGLNAGIIPGKKIGNRNTIGAGSILTRSIQDDALYVGNPAQKMKFD